MTIQVIEKILRARVYDVATKTPLEEMGCLSERLGHKVLIKREDLQPIFSFKIRGAYNKISQLTDKQKAKGLCASSAGNHAQGVAYSAKALGIKATIVMPKTTPPIKVDSVRALGAKAVLVGDSYEDAYAYALQEAKSKGLTFIHPYDDLDVIAGQGTIAMEMLSQYQDSIDAIFVCVGGGGLVAGIAAYTKFVRPETKIIAVEPEESACLAAALSAKKRVILDRVGIFADGVAVKQIGKQPFDLLKSLVDETIQVSTDEICAAVKDIFDDTRSIAEPAGALGVAGIKKYCARRKTKGKTYACLLSGANINFDRLRHISERAEIGEQKEALFAVTIPEKSGSFKAFCRLLGKRRVTEFNYRYASEKEAHIFVGLELEDPGVRQSIKSELLEKGYAVVDLTDDELAKLHIRHMVGGRGQGVTDEQLYRFQFPERPGALIDFLNEVGNRWNISLFHYRNHGAAYGRVLVGLQVPKGQKRAFKTFLNEIELYSKEETGNKGYSLFLK